MKRLKDMTWYSKLLTDLVASRKAAEKPEIFQVPEFRLPDQIRRQEQA